MNLESVRKKLSTLGFTDGKLGKDDFDAARALGAFSLIDKNGNVVLDADNLAATLANLVVQTPPILRGQIADLLLSEPAASDTKGKAETLMAASLDAASLAAAVAAPGLEDKTLGNQIRGVLNSQFGIRLQSTGDMRDDGLSYIIMETIGASPKNPCLVTFEQHILDPFTGPGQFDLVEREARRRSYGGASAGGTPVLTDPSGVMNWQPGDVDKLIRIGQNPGRVYKIISRQNSLEITLSSNITLPSVGLTLTMNGSDESEVTIATKSGFTDGDTKGGWSRLAKAITADKVYRVDFVPGDAGDGIYSISAGGLNGGK